jgi:hypothetical protein
MTLGISMKCRYAECHYAESHVIFIVMLNVIMLSVVMFSVAMLNVIKLSVMAPGCDLQRPITLYIYKILRLSKITILVI